MQGLGRIQGGLKAGDSLGKPLCDPRANEGVRRSPSAGAELQDLLGPLRQRVCAPQAVVSALTAQRHHSSPSLP